MKPGRNDPCPCGSGKKYKQCCLAVEQTQANPPEELAWRRIRRELEGHPTRMLRFMTQLYGPEAVDEAWEEFTLWDEAETPFDPDTPHIPVFMPWMFHHWAPNPDETGVADSALHGIPPTRAYLESKGSRLSTVAREYLQSCLVQPFSFYEVTHCIPGQGFTLRNLLTGQSHEVLERSASQSLQVHDALFGQLACAQGITLLEATSPVVIPPDDKIAIIHLRKRMRAAEDQTDTDDQDAIVQMWDIEMRELYLDLSHRLLYPQLPQLQNSDGEMFEFHKLVFGIDSPMDVFGLLEDSDAQALGLHLLHETVEHTANGKLRRARFDWLGNDASESGSHTVMGTLQIDDGKLIGEVNSRERADALTDIIGQILGTHASFRLDEVSTVEQALADRKPETSHATERGQQDDPEAQALISDYLQRHYRTWLDTALPALNGRTPRQAVRIADGREQVSALLQKIERDGQDGRVPVDKTLLDDLYRELGLDQADSESR